mgnify:FL=1
MRRSHPLIAVVLSALATAVAVVVGVAFMATDVRAQEPDTRLEEPGQLPTQPTAQELLHEALFREGVLGDPAAALPLYEQLIAQPTANPLLTGLAMLRAGECSEKLGQQRRAFEYYADVLSRFSNVASLRDAVAQKLIFHGIELEQSTWLITPAEARNILRYTSLEPIEKDGRIMGLQVHWREKAPVGGSASGLRAGDILTEVNGVPLTSLAGLLQAIDVMKTANVFTIVLLRDGQEITLEYRIGGPEAALSRQGTQ